MQVLNDKLINLPRVYVITGADPAKPKEFLMRLSKVILKGFRLIQLRANDLTINEYESLAVRAIEICNENDTILILNTDINIALKLNASGLHLKSIDLMRAQCRPLPNSKLISASCHTMDQLLQAAKIGVDFVTLSPVLPTASHPGEKILGWERFRDLCGAVDFPVFALGGMKQEHIQTSSQYGGYGIAAISSIWNTV